MSRDTSSHTSIYDVPAGPVLPNPGMKLDLSKAALVVIDPQIDFLSPDGVSWGVFGKSITEHNTVEHIGQLFAAAKEADIIVAVSPHYYYPCDHEWHFGGPLEKVMHSINMFDQNFGTPTNWKFIMQPSTSVGCPDKNGFENVTKKPRS